MHFPPSPLSSFAKIRWTCIRQYGSFHINLTIKQVNVFRIVKTASTIRYSIRRFLSLFSFIAIFNFFVRGNYCLYVRPPVLKINIIVRYTRSPRLLYGKNLSQHISAMQRWRRCAKRVKRAVVFLFILPAGRKMQCGVRRDAGLFVWKVAPISTRDRFILLNDFIPEGDAST